MRGGKSHDRRGVVVGVRPRDPLAGDARSDRRARARWSPPSARGSPPKAGAPGCSRARHPTGSGARAAIRAISTAPTAGPCHALMLLRDMGLDPASAEARRAVAPGARPHHPLRGRPALLRRRGRGLHQRARAEPRRLFRRALRDGAGAAAGRAARGRRLELRGAAERALLVPQHDLRPGGAPGIRAGQGRHARGDGGPRPRRGLSPGAPHVPQAVVGRGDQSRLDPVLVPARLPLRRAARAGLPAKRRRPARRPDRRGDSTWCKRTGAATAAGPAHPHADVLDFDLAERADEPSRWNTLRALRVLDWAGRGG